MSSVILWLTIILLFVVGLIGTIIPVLPGLGLIFAGIALYAILTSFATISKITVISLGIVALLSYLANYLATGLAAKQGGGKRYAFFASIVGALVGISFSLPGLIIGAFIGAILGALYEGANYQKAFKVATFAVVGIIGAAVFQVIIAIVMIMTFFIAIIF